MKPEEHAKVLAALKHMDVTTHEQQCLYAEAIAIMRKEPEPTNPRHPQYVEGFKAGHAAGRLRGRAEKPPHISDAEISSLRAALKWYADGNHFEKCSPDAWDTVSGEPQNWWCDEAGTAMVEDGSLASMVIEGKLTGAQLHALEDGEFVEETEPTGALLEKAK